MKKVKFTEEARLVGSPMAGERKTQHPNFHFSESKAHVIN
jgi:hypothetical protein